MHFQPGSHSASVENLKVAPSAELLRSSRSRRAKKKNKKKKKEIELLTALVRYQNVSSDQCNPFPPLLIIYIASLIFIYFFTFNYNCLRLCSAAVQDGNLSEAVGF